jgi:hypothetical protein
MMSEEERYLLDLNGYFVRPSILTTPEIASITDQIDRLHHDPASLPAHLRAIPSGPSSILIDHPSVIDVVREVIGPEVRLEIPASIWRTKGDGWSQPLHRGSSNVDGRPGDAQSADPLTGYRVSNGRIHAGQLRVCFELTGVSEGDGGTAFVPGSHKSEFLFPFKHEAIARGEVDVTPYLRSYSCPSGSAVFFTEAVIHQGPPWLGAHPRVAVFHLYNHVAIQWTTLGLPAHVVAELSLEHQAYFRPAWWWHSGALNTTEHFLETVRNPPDASPAQ